MSPVTSRRSSSDTCPGVPFTLLVTSLKAASKASSSPGLIVANTIIRAGIGRLSFDVDYEFVHHHLARLAQLAQRGRQLVLLGTALEASEHLPALPVACDDEATGVVGIAQQRLTDVPGRTPHRLCDRPPGALEIGLAAALHLHGQRRPYHVSSDRSRRVTLSRCRDR